MELQQEKPTTGQLATRGIVCKKIPMLNSLEAGAGSA